MSALSKQITIRLHQDLDATDAFILHTCVEQLARVGISATVVGAPSQDALNDELMRDVCEAISEVIQTPPGVGLFVMLVQEASPGCREQRAGYVGIERQVVCEELCRFLSTVPSFSRTIAANTYRPQNLDAPVLEVFHRELERGWPDRDSTMAPTRRFISVCPACKTGWLHIRRDEKRELSIMRHDRCSLCGQRVYYLDDEIGGEKVPESQR